jgi:hypothetical protein
MQRFRRVALANLRVNNADNEVRIARALEGNRGPKSLIFLRISSGRRGERR